jgi:hypothetical protein
MRTDHLLRQFATFVGHHCKRAGVGFRHISIIIIIIITTKAGRPLWSSGQSSWLQNGDVLCFL